MEGAKRCLEEGCRVIAVTLGKGTRLKNTTAAGYIRNTANEYVIKPQDTGASIETTGAGDAFAAGFLYGIINNKELKECGRLGDIIARFSISKTGARESLPTLSELTRRYRQL